jgi:hypothetical protein
VIQIFLFLFQYIIYIHFMSMCRMDGGDGLGDGISEFMSAMG